MHSCADIISSVPFFEDAEAGFTTSLVTCLTPQVSLRGDFIVREGEISREMYFIKSGAVQVLVTFFVLDIFLADCTLTISQQLLDTSAIVVLRDQVFA